MPNKYTEGLQQVGDLYRIRENLAISKKDLRVVDTTKRNISESLTGQNIIKSYRMKIWEIGKTNLNGRNYDAVAEKVLREKPVTLGLMDHPEGDSDGRFVDVFAVQSKPLIENGWLTVQMDLVGDHGKLVEEVIEKGGIVGVSSSCLGRVNEKGEVLADNSFMLERYGDVVMRPSNNYYHKKEDVVTESADEPIKENTTIVETNKDNNKIVKEKTDMADKSLKLNLKGMLREARKVDSKTEKLEMLEEALTYCDEEGLESIKEEISTEIQVVSESIQARANEADKLEETVQEKEAEVKTVKESVKENEVKVEKLKGITESLKKDFNMNKALLESQTALREEADSKVVILERDNAELIEKNALLEKEIAELKEAKKGDDDKEDDKDDEKADKPEMDDEETKEEKKDKKKESVSVNTKVKEFYLDSIKNDKKLRESRKDILACGTLEEAQALVLKLTNKVEIKESNHEEVDNKVVEGAKSASDVTARLREKWSI